MKLVSRIINIVLLGITIILSIVLAFIELRSLFAGDYSLFNNPAAGFVGYLFRGLYFVIILVFSIFLLIIYLTNKEMKFIYYFIGMLLLIGSLFTVFFYSTYIYFLVILITLLMNITFVLKKLFHC